MRFFEIILLLLGALLPFMTASKKMNIANKWPLILIGGIFILHALFEGFRWQMTPIYFVYAIVIVCLSKGYAFFNGNWFRKTSSGVFLFLMIGLGFFLAKALPVFDFPAPTGTYKVGSQYLHFTTNEEEYITDELGDKRALMIKVWYPAHISDELKEPYLNESERKGFAAKYGLPQNIFNYLDKVETNTYLNAEVAKGRFPLLIFSHGYYSKATGYYALIEEIVSQGYIVLNINHTYESVGALFPSGQIKLYSTAYDKKHNNEEMAGMIWTAMEDFKKATNNEEKSKAIHSTLKKYYAAEITHRWSKDIGMVVNHIPEWEASTFLSSHIDISKIGVFGHSQGGAAAGQALLDHSKISAGINIDGVQWGSMVDTFCSKPFLQLSSDWPEGHPDFNEIAFQNGSTSDLYMAKIKNTGHSNFMDIPLMINLPIVNEAGTIEPKKAISITAKVVVDFFNKYLNNKDVNLLTLPKSNLDLAIEKREKRID